MIIPRYWLAPLATAPRRSTSPCTPSRTPSGAATVVLLGTVLRSSEAHGTYAFSYTYAMVFYVLLIRSYG